MNNINIKEIQRERDYYKERYESCQERLMVSRNNNSRFMNGHIIAGEPLKNTE